MDRGRRTPVRLAWAVAVAAGLAAVQAPVGAQLLNSFPLTGGPLWWMPENNSNWSRFHDVWHNSGTVENAAWDATTGRGAATSFPLDTWVVTKHRGSYETNAFPNSACDYRGGVEYFNVGPPLNDSEYNGRLANDGRWPRDNSGGAGGLQTSVHIGEWWQGLYFQQVPGSTYAWPANWGPTTSTGSSVAWGSYRVTTRDANGGTVLAFDTNGPWSSMGPRPGMFLSGSLGGGTHGCIGQALVMMHGTSSGHGLYPREIADANGDPCYSHARLFILRANTEARCEPDLSRRYDMTERFWDWFESHVYNATTVQVPDTTSVGNTFPALFPSNYDVSEPKVLFRRGEFALFTVGEFAAADARTVTVPWTTPTYQVGTGTGRRADLARFVDDATRPQAFGGGTMTLRNNTGGVAGVEECLEIAPAGWDDVTGTFNPQCLNAWTDPNRFTGVVNHETDGAGQATRPQEVGLRDNRTAIGVATIQSFPDLWNEAGYDWFEHRTGTVGCLMLRKLNNALNLAYDAFAEETRLMALGAAEYRIHQGCGPGGVPCTQAQLDSQDRHVQLVREALGWRLIGEWRQQNHLETFYSNFLPEYQTVTAGDSAVLHALGKGPTLLGLWTNLDVENNRCYTGPVGQSEINEKLAPIASTQVPASEWMNPAWSGQTFWGTDMRDEAWWNAAGKGDAYHWYAEVRGSVTNRTEAAARARTGLAEPFPLDMDHDYGGTGIRRGQFTFREFACPTVDHGYYALGATHLGPRMLGHRDAPAGEAWKNADPLIDVNDAARRYATGTPCVDAATSPVSALTGAPLAEYYNVEGSDPATLTPGGERCFEARQPTPAEIADGIPADAWMPVDGEPGQYSVPGRGGIAGGYRLEYSGDPDVGVLAAGDPKWRPTSYQVVDNRSTITLRLMEPSMTAETGMPSLDLERTSMGPWALPPLARLSSSETYAGVAPGFCATCGVPTLDEGTIEYEGPIRFFGAMGIGGTGGCVLVLPTGPLDAVDASQPGHATDVMSPDQSLVCMLPTASVREPQGTCPRPGVGP